MDRASDEVTLSSLSNRYTLTNPLGKGRYAGVWATHNENIVVKYYFNENVIVDSFRREVNALIHLRSRSNECRHVVQYIDSGINYSVLSGKATIRPWMAMRAEKTTVRELLRFCGEKYNCAIPERYAKDIIRQTLHGAIFIRDCGVIHFDIKPCNLLLDTPLADIDGDKPFRVLIADFGTAFFADNIDEIPCGTSAYASPEVLAESPKASYPADIWSIGATTYKLLTDEHITDPDDSYEHFRLRLADESDDSDGSDNSDASDDASNDTPDAPDNMDEDSGNDRNENDDNRVILRCLEHIMGIAPPEVQELFPALYSNGLLADLAYPVENIPISELLERRFNIENSLQIANFIESCMRYIPSERATAEQLLSHDWLK